MGSNGRIPKRNQRSLRKCIEDIKRKKIASKKVVNLQDFRELRKNIEEAKVILVVDDEEIIRNGLKRILESQGYKVILAGDGMELSKVLESSRLDLIMLDVNLPWVDGLELCKLIKGNQGFQKVPLILISGRKTEVDVQIGFKAGCDDYIAKPFDVDAITTSVSRAFEKIPS